jgi:hypothetical protein
MDASNGSLTSDFKVSSTEQDMTSPIFFNDDDVESFLIPTDESTTKVRPS